ncbi:hypothetical protein BX661DRAFT_174764 [Kickxella alabastrina]|uniref:uncharacterized protein n=1 Tax=Kickxella alabastrina TaxID=61397 RepID=UPI002220A967|nr:uncharacterized protein BX661DRAFT_174764 [Kickxella alabastrina]KAI7834403.1 hypothetical protein BX661DRAFT_174764 [Kickxella alabastrina]
MWKTVASFTGILVLATLLLDSKPKFDHHSLRHRNNVKRQETGSVVVTDIPDYILVSPDFVALAPTAPGGLSVNGINNMLCLANRLRYDQGIKPLALDAQLVRFAQSRAEFLSSIHAIITNNNIVGMNDPLPYNNTVWSVVTENLVHTQNNPTFAYWEIQGNKEAASNLANPDFMYFGAGHYDGYFVQVFGKPVKPTTTTDMFPLCTANQTFFNWVYPNGSPDKPVDKSNIVKTAYPYAEIEKISPLYYSTTNEDHDNGRTNDIKYYFTPKLGNVPHLKSLEIIDSVAPADSKTPYAAIASSGEQGMTEDELNLLVCLINARRYESCLPPVALHPQLIAAAQAHSYEMNFGQNMSHYGAMGSVGQRIKRRGFSFRNAGENVVANTHEVYAGHVTFMQSQGHLNNIINPKYTFIGGGRSGQFWTVNFANYMNDSMTPDPMTLPLCPGNATNIAIAFPNGLPSEPKLEKTACGNTVATSIVPPPYIQEQRTRTDEAAVPTSSVAQLANSEIIAPTATISGVVYVTVVDVVTSYVEEGFVPPSQSVDGSGVDMSSLTISGAESSIVPTYKTHSSTLLSRPVVIISA